MSLLRHQPWGDVARPPGPIIGKKKAMGRGKGFIQVLSELPDPNDQGDYAQDQEDPSGAYGRADQLGGRGHHPEYQEEREEDDQHGDDHQPDIEGGALMDDDAHDRREDQ